MKRLILCLLCLLLLCGCSNTAVQETSLKETTVSEQPTQETLPPELCGVWVSADAGERNMVETITFGEDGSLMVHLDYEGSDYSTIYGTYTVERNTVFCDITEGTTPFQVEYAYRVDGRELYLTDSDGTAQYLRNS